MLWTILARIGGLLVWAIPAMMALGFAAGLFVDTAPLKGLIVPFTFLMVYPMMVTLRVRKVFEGGGGSVQWVSQGINFGLLSNDGDLARWALILMALGISVWVWLWVSPSPFSLQPDSITPSPSTTPSNHPGARLSRRSAPQNGQN